MLTLSRTTAAVGAVGLIAAGLASAAPANAVSSVFEIKVTEVQTSYHQTWNRHDLPRAGDSFSFQSNLRQDGSRVGKDAGKCTFQKIYGDRNNPDSAKVRCDVTFHFFNRGTLRAIGTKTIDWNDIENSNIDVTIPIVDGTGRYRDANGTVRNNQINDHRAQLTFRLTGVHSS